MTALIVDGEIAVCEVCNHEIQIDEAWDSYNDTHFCESCIADRSMSVCACCDRFEEQVVYDTVDGMVCSECRSENYRRCYTCGLTVPESNYDDECDECDQCARLSREKRGVIHDYSYKPDPIFFGSPENQRFFGVEIEVEHPSFRKNLKDLAKYADSHEELYCKEDGSLGNGFEIVTHPCSLSYFQNEGNCLDSVLAEALNEGYYEEGDSCGLHVHVSKISLGNSWSEIDLAIAKMVILYNCHTKRFLKFSRRTQDELDAWARNYTDLSLKKDGVSGTIEKIKYQNGYDRHICINTQPSNTVEFRMFKGTIDPQMVKACVEMVDFLCDFVTDRTLNQILYTSWSFMVKRIKSNPKYKNLAKVI